MTGLKTKVSTQFRLVCALSALCSSTLAVATPPSLVLEIPNWGFASKQLSPLRSTSRSLIFDQAFDKVSYRPMPQARPTSIAIVAPTKAPAAKVEVVVKKAPGLLRTAVPTEWMDTVHAQLQNLSQSPRFAAVKKPSVVPAPLKIPPTAREAAPITVIASDNSPLPQKSLFQRSSRLLKTFAATVTSTPVARLVTPAPIKVSANKVPDAAPLTKEVETPIEDAQTEEIQSNFVKKFVQPRAEAEVAKIFVMSEESLMSGEPQAVVDAEVNWVSVKSGLISRTDANGVARSPYRKISSMRFIVNAPGYLPAVGYAVGGMAIPVVLSSEARLAPIIKSLKVIPDATKTLVIGKVLDRKLRAISNVTVDTSVEKPFSIFYSFGELGIFHPQAKLTGPQGDFFISGMRDGIQYFMPSQTIKTNVQSANGLDSEQIREWPATIMDMSGLPSVVTVTLMESTKASVLTQVLDAQTEERPDVGVHLIIGGQRGVYVPDAEGYFKLADLHYRNSVDLVEIRAQGYIKTWITSLPNPQNFPEAVLLYKQNFLDELFGEYLYDVDMAKGVTFGHLRPERFNRPVEIRVYNNTGKESDQAKIFYGDAENNLSLRKKSTDSLVQSFAITNLDAGEWHVLVLGAKSQKVLDAQVLRTEAGTLSQLQF